jgi:hypothetical protein
VNSSWSESDIYWYNHPDCAFTAEDIIALPATATHQYEYWDISGLVQGWIDGSITNYGACVKDANENTWDGRRHFASSDISIIDYRPILVISYYDPTAP